MVTIITGEYYTSQYSPSAAKGDFILISNAFMGITPSDNGAVYLEYPHYSKFFTNKFIQCKSTFLGATIDVDCGEGGEASFNCGLKNTNGNIKGQSGFGVGLCFFLCAGLYVAEGNSYVSCPDEKGHGGGVVMMTGVNDGLAINGASDNLAVVSDNNFTSDILDADFAVNVGYFDSYSISYNTFIGNKLNSLALLRKGNNAEFECSNIVNNTQRKSNTYGMIMVDECKVVARGLICISDIFNKVASGDGITLKDCKFYDCQFNVPVETVAVRPNTNTLSNAPFTQCY